MNFFRLYINSSVHVALAVVSFYVVTAIELGLDLKLNLALFLFFASVSGYNFVKYAGIAQLHHLSLTANLRLIQLFSLVCFVLMLFFGFQLSWASIALLSFLAALNALYALPVFSQQKNLRSMPFVKVFVIALVWAVATVVFPWLEAGRDFTFTILAYAFLRFLLLVGFMIPFEIRDMEYDYYSVTTIPNFMGLTRTKLFGVLLLVLSILIANTLLDTTNLYIYIGVVFVLMIFILFSRQNQSPYYASFWVEAIPVVYALLSVFIE